MKTITVNLYQFSELSETAKQKAIEDRTEKNQQEEYHWNDDAIKSIEKLAEKIGIKVLDYSINWGNEYDSRMFFSDSDDPFTQKELEELGEYNPITLKGLGECVLTGYSADEDAIDGLRAAFLSGETDRHELMEAAFKTWIKACVYDYEYQISEELAEEQLNEEETDFYEDGTIYNN